MFGKEKHIQIMSAVQIARYYFVIFGLLHTVWYLKKTMVLTSH